ncbi:DNA-binding domain-containing protein, AraC-type [Shewanella psychrophila]|uniref:DNA-binding domain-containing protein, AraC-type n=1 Tax=Shewanella psychrophila TaxID=225848 RepID=A0A1S6HIZ6_9GAMM|nr:helix-turn-helix domain-containing protein [Shewanella psychrophila]AQS35503.1 DNA-binding domain-containing protein, AraC-type [Shewanella psychrophila]
MSNRSPLTRIEGVLEYIHDNLDKSLSLEELAEQSCWSRWQLQRVFQSQTGLSVAQYVRELKLSLAAERMITGGERMLDIAYELGFNSEVSFSRAFKQFFGSSPREYKLRGVRVGLRNPLTKLTNLASSSVVDSAFLQTRIEYRPAFSILGVSSPIKGVLSDSPDFSTIVPETWRKLHDILDAQLVSASELIGVVDTRIVAEPLINYWAGIESQTIKWDGQKVLQTLNPLEIPAQEYAVVSYTGAISGFSHVVEWLICTWLPESGYSGVEGLELETYGAIEERDNEAHTEMEYWLPVERKV